MPNVYSTYFLHTDAPEIQRSNPPFHIAAVMLHLVYKILVAKS